jgi:transcriptional regulator with XRE-family HTH domain
MRIGLGGLDMSRFSPARLLGDDSIDDPGDAGDLFELRGEREGEAAATALQVRHVAVGDLKSAREFGRREAASFLDVREVHRRKFARREPARKTDVRKLPDDTPSRSSQTAYMARRQPSQDRVPTVKRLAQHEEFRRASGWYLAAWRDYRGLTLEELAEDVGSSKGAISDLETGRQKSDGTKPARFNRDTVDLMAKALRTTGGRLIDMNPFTVDQEALEAFGQVPEQDRARVLQIVRTFTKDAAEGQ